MTVRRAWRRTAAPAGVAYARLRARPGRNLLLVVGIAAATAMFAAVLGGTTVARDRSLQRMIGGLPAADRSFRVDLVGIPAEADPVSTDAAARRALAQLTDVEPARVVAFRDFWLDGVLVRIGGIYAPRRAVRLLSGRFPRRCDRRVCEVLQLGPGGRPSYAEADLHFARVGTGELRDPDSLGPAYLNLRQLRAQGSRVTALVLLAPSASSIERLPSLELISRLESWVVPLAAVGVHEWEVPDVLGRETRAQALLENAHPSFALYGPDAALVEAKERGDVHGERMALVGGSVAVALFGFALVGAVGLRRGLAAERRRLTERGATGGQVAVATMAEVGAIGVVGWLAGVLAGTAAVAAVAASVDVPAAAALRHSLLTGEAVLSLGAGLLLAVLVVGIVARGDDDGTGRRGRVRPLDVAVLGALVAVLAGVSRGALDAGAGSSTGDRTFLLLLPSLVCIAGGLAAARLLGPFMTLAERLSRRASIALRLALLALARAPARTSAAGAFLVVAVGLAVFASAYRSTLDRGIRDEAAFTVPLDFTLTSGASLLQPLDVAGIDGYEHLGAGVRAFAVLRTTVNAVGEGASVQSPTLLGVPSQAFAAMRWRSDHAESSHASLAERFTPVGDTRLRGVALTPDTNAFRLRARLSGTPLAVALVVRDDRGRLHRLSLGTARRGRSSLSAPVSALRGIRPRDVVALELALSGAGRAWLLHLAREGRIVRVPTGTVVLGPLQAVGPGQRARSLTGWRGWIARGRRARLAGHHAEGVEIRYAFPEATSLYLRPRQPTDTRQVPVLASPAVAAAAGPDGLITLDFYESQVAAKVVGVARRFPTVGEAEEFVVGDEQALATALDADAPGTGTPGELWLAVPRGGTRRVERALSQPPFSRLEHVSRERLHEQARSDPLARSSAATLGAAAIVALMLALAGLWAVLLSDVRDERDTLFDLEAQGAGPETLRRYLRVRALLLLAFGLAGGLVLGVVLSRLVASLVQVTGTATDPFPPLVLDAGLGTLIPALALLLAAAVLAVELTSRRAFRGASPERASWSFE